MNEEVARLTVSPTSTIREAMEAIDRGAVAVALVVDEEECLVGTVTDGDVRRALLRGATMDDAISKIVTRAPVVAGPETDRTEILDLMRAHRIEQVPIVTADGRLLGLHFMRDLLGGVDRPNWAVIMAGGRGTRLRPYTSEIPKPMLPVAGRPILERLVLFLAGAGIRRVFLAVNYKAEMIEEHFGAGEDFGCLIEYLHEDPDRPLGTAGALAFLEAPDHPLIVMNGDLVTQFSVGELLEHHSRNECAATIAVREYVHQVPFGVIRESGTGFAEGLTEKPAQSWLVNAGIYVLEPEVLERIPRDQRIDLPEVIDDLIRSDARVGAWRVHGEWLDVGTPGDLGRARGLR